MSELEVIRPPWTDDQVDALKRYQTAGFVHPYTCGREHPDTAQSDRKLWPTPDGWRCQVPYCDYQQNWAYAQSFQPQTHPLEAFRFRAQGAATERARILAIIDKWKADLCIGGNDAFDVMRAEIERGAVSGGGA